MLLRYGEKSKWSESKKGENFLFSQDFPTSNFFSPFISYTACDSIAIFSLLLLNTLKFSIHFTITIAAIAVDADLSRVEKPFFFCAEENFSVIKDISLSLCSGTE